MNRKRVAAIAGVALLAVLAAGLALRNTHPVLVLTGVVTTNDVLVSPQIGGRVDSLPVAEGDSVVPGQLVAVIAPDELRADQAYYAHSAAQSASQTAESEAALRYEEQQAEYQVQQAEATLAAAEASRAEAEADLENATITFRRDSSLAKDGGISAQELDQARTTRATAAARVASLEKQVQAQTAEVALARSAIQQVAMRRSALAAARQGLAAAEAQQTKAGVRLAYTEVRAPIAGIVDVRPVRRGEVVTAGQPLVTLINPDDLWVRADVEESYIDRVRVGDTLTVRLPSGEERTGTVFFRGVDADFATQRDVSRTKRDIRTFEIRLRVDNRDRRLAVGMTAYVLFPTAPAARP
jgi:HlyD family secretion protein